MIECVVISLYDTTLPDVVVAENILDYAEEGSISLSYAGSDSKLQYVLSSTLEFSLEVSIENSFDVLKYDYLFSGEEFRYKVVMSDQDGNVLWSGFLIPDEYLEPFTTGTFYINVAATDGIGLLKGIKLWRYFYKGRQSIIKSLADCLRKTSLELELWVDPSVVNYLAQKDWRTLFVDAASVWGSGESYDNYDDCYTIIEDCLKIMGCTLFQQNDRWYVIGHNRRGDLNPIYVRYNQYGELINQYEAVAYLPTPLQMYGTPMLSLKPPFKSTEYVLDLDEEVSVFPEDIVNQPAVVINAGAFVWIQDPAVRYFYFTGEPLSLRMTYTGSTYVPGEPNEVEGNVLFLGAFVNEQVYPDNMAYYLAMKEPVYIKAGMKISIELTLESYWLDADGNGDVDNDINNDMLMYEFRLNDTTIVSNKRDFARRNDYLMEFEANRQVSSDDVKVVSKLTVEEYEILEDGYLDFRQYYGVSLYGNSPTAVVVTQLSVSSVQQAKSFKRTRVLKRSNTFSEDLKLTDSFLDFSKNAIVYQPYLEQSLFTEIDTVSFYYNGNSTFAVGRVLFVSEAAYNTLGANENKLYFRRNDTDYYEYLNEYLLIERDGLYMVKIHFKDGYEPTSFDFLYVYSGAAGNPQTLERVLAREQWAKANFSNGYKRLGITLSELTHDVYGDPLVGLECIAKGFFFPLDVLNTEINGSMRKLMPMRIKIYPERNETSLFLIENKNRNIQDYG